MTFPTQGIPAGMIFIPCKEGKSHCPEEAIRWEDAATGAQILADTIMRMAREMGGEKAKRRRGKGGVG
jgi:beta-ureidopropionase / N-carbamoyl-L-amino-acid hydrolase